MAGDYPTRDQFFAHKFVRLLQKSCAALDLGQGTCLLLCFVAHTEDAARYSGPVRFWNEQLMTTMGWKSPKQLNDARKRAVDAGWLVYHREGHREVGRYWVTIPEEYSDVPDSVIEPIHSAGGTNNGMNSGTNKERKAERIGDELRNEKVTESGKPSNPIPIPIPIPEKTEGASTKRSVSFVPPTVPEVVALAVAEQLLVDGRDFVNFYASKNWMVGKSKMKDWKAAARGWDSRNRKGNQHGNGNAPRISAAQAREQSNADAFAIFEAAAAAQCSPGHAEDWGESQATLCIEESGPVHRVRD